MKYFCKWILICVCWSLSIIIFKTALRSEDKRENENDEIMKICCVVCGAERAAEALTMMKSSLLFESRRSHIEFIILTEPTLFALFYENLNVLKTQKLFTFQLHQIEFPVDGEHTKQTWQNLFKPCAAQRLFLPSILKHENSILYVDTDVLFLTSPDEIFDQFHHFKAEQHCGLVHETESKSFGWYPRFALHPFYGEMGLNSGVMLMNLENMRKVRWEDQIQKYFNKYQKQIVYGDQDLVNIYFHDHPNEVKTIPCEFNYRADHCMHYNDFCEASEGVKIIHGNRGMFHKMDEPIFMQIYLMFKEFELGNVQENQEILKETIQQINRHKNETNCNRLSDKILLQLKRSLLDQKSATTSN